MDKFQLNEASPNNIGRRQFAKDFFITAGAASLLPVVGLAEMAQRTPASFTVQQVIDLFLKTIPGAPFPNTVDTLKAGDPNQVVKGIATTMFATIDVIEKAAKLGVNFIIAHEPAFYNHTDETTWLASDPVYQYKRNLLDKHGIAVWRCHDYLHAHKPDGVQMGVLTALGWASYYDATKPRLVAVPQTTLQHIIALVKKNLNIPHVRFVGDLNALCSRIVLIPGAAGGRMQIAALEMEKPDLLIVGEVNEWETSEYVRDLRKTNATTNLLVLGHIQSEEPGLTWLADFLKPQLPGISIHHIASADAFRWA